MLFSLIQIQNLKSDLSTRDNEIIGLKMKVDTLTNQGSEHQHYINVLKDNVKSKEQQLSMFNADVSTVH
jgi:peptidoglycan hydrolase CwlO-like protein